jgi:hypothetical protein
MCIFMGLNRQKISSPEVKTIFLIGFQGTNIRRIWDPEKDRVFTTSDVAFEEDFPEEAKAHIRTTGSRATRDCPPYLPPSPPIRPCQSLTFPSLNKMIG